MTLTEITSKIQSIPSRTRAIGFFAFVGVLIVLFIWQVHIPKSNEIKQLKKDLVGLHARIKENDAKIAKLEELKAEVRALQERLALLTAQLPPETEVSGLLRQIQHLVTRSNLSMKLWRPGNRRTHPSGLYVEIPIAVELSGGYHKVAIFFDRVSKMTRIVNMLNVNMGSAKMNTNGSMNIKVTCTAMTFAAVEKKANAPAKKKR